MRQERPIAWISALEAIGWCTLIFATSSTVILPRDLFAWLAKHVFNDESAVRSFVVFWRYAWFVVVKGWHATEFAILFMLIYTLLKSFKPTAISRNVGFASALCLLFAMSDEYHQTFVPGRNGAWLDVVIDSLGVGLACALVLSRGTKET